MAAAHLPRFSDPRDVDEFVDVLDASTSAEISRAEQFRAFRLLRGVYGQRQEGTQMIRVKIPFGRLDSRGLEALADVGETLLARLRPRDDAPERPVPLRRR